MKRYFLIVLLVSSFSSFAQTYNTDSLRKIYFAEQKKVSNQFSAVYYPFQPKIYSLDEKQFLRKIDSLKTPFDGALNNYKKINHDSDAEFITNENRDIVYFFDRMILDYPYFHEIYAEKKIKLSKPTQARLDKHLADFNNPVLLSSADVRGYIMSFLRHESSAEVKKSIYIKSDNKRLDAYFNLIPKYFSNQECKEFWAYYYLSNHLEEWGSKHIQEVVKKFRSDCRNELYRTNIDSMYTLSLDAGKDHLIKTYKTVDGYDLDMHIFLPDSTYSGKRPVVAYFSGGSWTKGNPEWAFYSCADYAKRGWVGVSVEYRLADRHETTPFEAVKDARSAIRWLRMNANAYHIDTNRIVISGNSAGGHLALTTALANEWNESTDNLNYSPVPDLVMVNAGVYNLYADESTAWIMRDLKDKKLAEKISPQQLLKRGTPPMLIIHGTNDRSVDYATAKIFAEKMKAFGNEITFETLDGAPHHIWFDRRFSGKVSALRKDFLKKHGY